jgi:hypothetical protein
MGLLTCACRLEKQLLAHNKAVRMCRTIHFALVIYALQHFDRIACGGVVVRILQSSPRSLFSTSVKAFLAEIGRGNVPDIGSERRRGQQSRDCKCGYPKHSRFHRISSFANTHNRASQLENIPKSFRFSSGILIPSARSPHSINKIKASMPKEGCQK